MANYLSRSDVEAVFSVDNVEGWADLNNNDSASEITARINDSLEYAEGAIDTRLEGGPYTVPLSATGNSLEVLKTNAAIFAGVWLYQSRGLTDTTTTDKMETLLKRANSWLNGLETGQSTLNAGSSHSGPTGMVLVF